MLEGGHPEWNAALYDILEPYFLDADFVQSYVGTPMKPSGSGALVNSDEVVEGYVLSQFKADVLLLAQPLLDEVRLNLPLDLSDLTFTIGPRIYVSNFTDVIARETRFGPYADIVSSTFDRFDAAGAEFYDQVSFTPSAFRGDAIFAGVEFYGGASMQAVHFMAAADFSDAVFHGWTAFAGALFEETPIFRNAEFREDTTFEAATFNASADFTGARFVRGVGTSGLDRDMRALIRAARQ